MINQINDQLNFIAVLVFAVLLFFLPSFTSPTVAANILILVILAIGFNILLGYGGEISLGHGGLLGFGAYATTLFLIHLNSNIILAVLFGVASTIVAGVIFGQISLYTRGIVFAMVTLAFGQIAFFLVYAFGDVLGAGSGLTIPTRIEGTVAGFDLFNTENLFLVLYILTLLAMIVSYRIINSPYGKILTAIGDNEQRASYLGYDTDRHLLVAFVISAGFAGLAGSLQAFVFFGSAPSVLNIQQSLEVLLGTLIGGAGTFGGPLIGMLVLELAKEYLTEATDHWPLFFGGMFVIFTYFLKSGGLYGVYLNMIEYVRSE